jgi:hypothetical protein
MVPETAVAIALSKAVLVESIERRPALDGLSQGSRLTPEDTFGPESPKIVTPK